MTDRVIAPADRTCLVHAGRLPMSPHPCPSWPGSSYVAGAVLPVDGGYTAF
jgi:hypothetical protein